MTAAAPAVELSPETIAELVPPCEVNQHTCPGLPCVCPAEKRRSKCEKSATWVLHVVNGCGHGGHSLVCESHRALIGSWLRDPHQHTECAVCGSRMPPKFVGWERL